MSATIAKLVRMANQIAIEFDNQGGDAAKATWDHVWHFWDPSMRAALIDAARGEDVGLTPTAEAAALLLATGLEPASQTRATEFGVDGEGNTEGDAG